MGSVKATAASEKDARSQLEREVPEHGKALLLPFKFKFTSTQTAMVKRIFLVK